LLGRATRRLDEGRGAVDNQGCLAGDDHGRDRYRGRGHRSERPGQPLGFPDERGGGAEPGGAYLSPGVGDRSGPPPQKPDGAQSAGCKYEQGFGIHELTLCPGAPSLFAREGTTFKPVLEDQIEPA
jgi:hypothetical protein